MPTSAGHEPAPRPRQQTSVLAFAPTQWILLGAFEGIDQAYRMGYN